MRALIQRVNHATVTVDEKIIGEIDKGLLVFLGIASTDTKQEADLLWRKLSRLRIFADAEGKTNLDIKAIAGNMMIISQFTLYANCRKGNRPSFVEAAPGEMGNQLYQYFLSLAAREFPDLKKGLFGRDMTIDLQNDGPFTILLDTDQL